MREPEALKAVLARLRARYLAASGAIVATFEGLATALDADPGDATTLKALHLELHRVHGTAGSYGFDDASALASALEPVAERWMTDVALDRAERAGIVRRFARALAVALSDR